MIQLDTVLTYDIEIDFISDNEVILNFTDGISVYTNGALVSRGISALEFNDGTNTTMSVDLNGGKARISVNSSASSGGTTSSGYNVLNSTLTQVSLTGTTADTKMHSFLVAPGRLMAGDIVAFRVLASKIAVGNSNMNIRVHVNTSDTLTGATQIARLVTAAATGTYIKLSREMYITSLTSQRILSTANSAVPDDIAAITTSITNLSIDFTVNQYFIISLDLGVATDTAILEAAIFEILRP